MRFKHFQKIVVLFLMLFFVFAGCGDDDDDASSSDDDVSDDDDDSDDEAYSIHVGFARVDISPTESVRMGGYGSFFVFDSWARMSDGVHDPIYAHAAAFEDADGDSAILMVLDNVGTITNEVVEIQAAISDATGLDEKCVVIASTHNHQSPDTIGLWGLLIPPRTGRNEPYIDMMVEKAAQAGVQAWEQRQPARLVTGSAQESQYHFNYVDSPQAILDSTLTVLGAYDENETLIGSIMNWAAHPTVMRMENNQISADYPGAYYRIMEQELGGIHMYVNGAIGASVQPLDPDTGSLYERSTWDDVDIVGGKLAQTAQQVLAKADAIDDADIWLLEAREVNVLVENFVFWLAAAAGIIPREIPPVGEYGTTYMATFAIGPVSFGTMPGEYGPDYSLRLREIMGGDQQILIGMGMDWIGYAITPEQYQNRDYFYERFLCPSRWAGEELMAVYEEIWNDQ